MTSPAVLGHGTGPGVGDWLRDPALIACVAAAVVYAIGHRRISGRSPRSPVVGRGRTTACGGGWAVRVVAVAPPLDGIADDLTSVHMVQHLLLGLVAPLLLVIATPLQVAGAALPRPVRRTVVRAGHRLTGPAHASRRPVALAALIVVAEVATWAVWHVPAAYDAAVRNEALHGVEHLLMFLTGCALWWLVVVSGWHERSGLAIVYLFLVGLPMGAIAALMTLAPRPLYESQLRSAAEWGVRPLQDQQIAGAVMWGPGGVVLLVVASVLFVRWLGAGPAPGERVALWDP